MSERSECRHSATSMLEKAEAAGYMGNWATVAIAGALLELSAAVWELGDKLDFHESARQKQQKPKKGK